MIGKIIDLILMMFGFILARSADKQAALIKFRKFFDDMEGKLDSADAMTEAERQIEELTKKESHHS